jgi:hypothetical protein
MSDGPCNWSKIFWCFAGNLFADLNLHRCDSSVAYDRKERGWWAPFVVPLDPAGVVAADHGVASQAGACHCYLLDALALLYLFFAGKNRPLLRIRDYKKLAIKLLKNKIRT